jgi:hypothetical protein
VLPRVLAEEKSCIAIALPVVEGMPGNAADVAAGVRDLLVSYLSGPSLKVVALEARLPSQAVEEAKQKGCEPLLVSTLSRKTGGGRLAKAFGQAASASSFYLPGGGSVASATARAATAGGLQVASSLAGSTKAKDEMRLEYRLESTAGRNEFGPKTENQTASADGEDLLTPVVMRAAENIVTRKAAK